MDDDRFPASFVWGAAASGPQSEGGLEHSDWIFRERAGLAPASGDGNDKRRRYSDDFMRLAELGLTHYRTSLEWSRIEPTRGVYAREVVDEYRQMMDSASRWGITLWVTLHHVTLPAWFAHKGGFSDETQLLFWHRYVEFVAKELGRHAEFWVPIHEPVIYAAGAYLLGLFPPAKKRMDKFLDMLVKIHRAHGDAHRILKAYLPSKAKVGTTALVLPVQPRDPANNGDVMAANFVDGIVNQVSFEALKHGVVNVPGRGSIEVPSMKGAADFIGIDYFLRLIAGRERQAGDDTRFRVLGEVEGMPAIVSALPGEPRSEFGSGVYAAGLYDAIKLVHQSDLGLPIYITASGLATADEDLRSRYLGECLGQVRRALAQGLDVRGYFHWSDVDQYEWNRGFEVHHGLFAFDPVTKERIARPAAAVLAAAARAGKTTAS